MRIKHLLLIALAALALSLASIGATAPAIAGGHSTSGDFYARLDAPETLIAGAKPGVAGGSNIAGAKPGIASGSNIAGSKPGIAGGSNIAGSKPGIASGSA